MGKKIGQKNYNVKENVKDNFQCGWKFPICIIGPIGRPRQGAKNGQQNRKIANVREIYNGNENFQCK